MVRTTLLILLACAIAVVGGGASLAYVLNNNRTIGSVQLGPWLAFPEAGTEAADPYHKAIYAIDGVLSLGAGEGLAMYAERDTLGEALRGECAYRLSADPASSRFWTLRSERRIDGVWKTGPAIHSRNLMRQAEGRTDVIVGARPAPGNWLPLAAAEPFRLVLTLYDPSSTARTSAKDVDAPTLTRLACND